jgi:phage terminase large subunit-like protein
MIEGGMKVKPDTKVCEITTEDEIVFSFFSQVDGYIIEFNENIEKDPNYLVKYV